MSGNTPFQNKAKLLKLRRWQIEQGDRPPPLYLYAHRDLSDDSVTFMRICPEQVDLSLIAGWNEIMVFRPIGARQPVYRKIQRVIEATRNCNCDDCVEQRVFDALEGGA